MAAWSGLLAALWHSLGEVVELWRRWFLATLNIQLHDSLEAAVAERVETLGLSSPRQYILGLAQAYRAADVPGQILEERMRGPFAPLESDWKDRVR